MAEEYKPASGLVLTGGGARAAYQAGVLKFLSDHYRQKNFPCSIFTGVSAGAINVVALAAGAANHVFTTERIWNIWKNLRHNTVFRSDIPTMTSIGVRFLADLVLGGKIFRPRSNYLLDNAPLRHLLQQEIIFSSLRLNLRRGIVRGVAISATNYLTGNNITFYESSKRADEWFRIQRISKSTYLTLEHLMASTAIPVFFPPVFLEGGFFGDGSIRMISPLSPAIHLGADKIFVINIRSQPLISTPSEKTTPPRQDIYMADIAGLILNSIFMDSLESDIERLYRINRSVERMTEEGRRTNPDQLRHISLLTINPTVDLGVMAAEQFNKFPKVIQHLLQGIGATGESGNELLSYLAFDSSYTSRVLQLGYEDAKAKKGEIQSFFEG